jgi:ribosomal protein S18 acetylase RimI-like enzyme
MDGPTLAGLEHENFILSMSTAAAQIPGAATGRDGGVASFLSGHPLLLFNQILPVGSGPEPGAIEEAVRVARGRGHRYIVSLRRGVDDDVIPSLVALGLEALDDGPWIPGMAMHPIPPDAGAQVAVDPSLEIRRVDDARGVEDHVVAAAAGFEMDEPLLRSIVTVGTVQTPAFTLYVGYVDGAPLVAGLGVRTGRAIGVYNIATAPVARRRGFGQAMTARVIADGVAAGCDVAVLQASDMGRSIYERMGFRTVVEYLGYVEPSPTA